MTHSPSEQPKPSENDSNAKEGITIISSIVDEAIIFKYDSCVILDIDPIFIETNKNFIKMFEILYLSVDFNFKDKNNKKIYKHCFIETMMEKFSNYNSYNKIIIHSNILTKDDFRQSLVKKLKTIFGLQLIETSFDFKDVVNLYQNSDSRIKPLIDISIQTQNEMKSLKKVKKFFEKNDLIHLNETYFNNPSKKLKLFH